MAVDIVLVLGSEHRRLRQLLDRCGRSSRGFQDPAQELHKALRAHVLAATAEVYPTAAALGSSSQWPAEEIADIRMCAESSHPAREELTGAAEGLIRIERHIVALLEQLGLDERRRLGKVFRIRRDAQLRGSSSGSRRRRSQTELYEMARRAGVEHRSRMTQAQLQAAIEARSSG